MRTRISSCFLFYIVCRIKSWDGFSFNPLIPSGVSKSIAMAFRMRLHGRCKTWKMRFYYQKGK